MATGRRVARGASRTALPVKRILFNYLRILRWAAPTSGEAVAPLRGAARASPRRAQACPQRASQGGSEAVISGATSAALRARAMKGRRNTTKEKWSYLELRNRSDVRHGAAGGRCSGPAQIRGF
jgi:hypothetical protein